jgi:hypothetical protein
MARFSVNSSCGGYDIHSICHLATIKLVFGRFSPGVPYDPRNLWPEPRAAADGWNADVKDELEAVLARQVCSGRVPLAGAQQAIAADWIAAYNRFVVGN